MRMIPAFSFLQGVNEYAIHTILLRKDQLEDIDEGLDYMLKEVEACLKDGEMPSDIKGAYLQFANAAILERQVESSGAPIQYFWRAYVSHRIYT